MAGVRWLGSCTGGPFEGVRDNTSTLLCMSVSAFPNDLKLAARSQEEQDRRGALRT